jgi:hypothetical protein
MLKEEEKSRIIEPTEEEVKADTAKTMACVVCQEAAKYTCPGCSRRTCSLACVQGMIDSRYIVNDSPTHICMYHHCHVEHKSAFSCTGKRDRTAFVKRGDLSYNTLVSDYKLLEDIKRVDDVAKRCMPPAPRRQLPAYLKSLVHQASSRDVTLQLLAPGMKKRKDNTTRYDNKSKILNWRVEWRVRQDDDDEVKNVYVTTRMSEHDTIQSALDRHLSKGKPDSEPTAAPQNYNVYMKKLNTPANEPVLLPVDTSKTLGEFLRGQYIIEFPVFEVQFPVTDTINTTTVDSVV